MIERNMDIDKRFELIKKDVLEVVDEKELRDLLKKKKSPVIYHGFEPSGEGLHIGCIIGINKHIDFQKAGLKLKLLCADFHAYLNEKGSLEKIRKIAQLYVAGFDALGVDMKKAEVVYGSDFQLKKEYFQDVMKMALKVRILRAKRSMSVIAREEEDPHVAQILYPLMQSLDMKYLGVDMAFGDMAQRKVHMIAREELPNLEFHKPIMIHHDGMTGLTGGKMSASIPDSRIMIDESPEEILRKINKAFCPANQVKDNPVLQICKYIIFLRAGKLKIERDKKYGGDLKYENYEDLEKDFLKAALHPQDLKTAVGKALVEVLAPVRKKMSSAKILQVKKEISKMK
ncbi:MAG: tyrosine--tRNA ligase [archaeon]